MSKIFKLIAALVIVLIIAVGAAGYFAWTMLQPVSRTTAEKQSFVIPKGQSLTEIGQRLTEAGFLKSPWVFRFLVWQTKADSKIQAGSFSLSADMTPSAIVDQLTKGTNDQWITVLEGWRKEEIAEMLDTQHLSEFNKDEFLKLSENDEGYLFPDTYLIPRLSTAETVHTLLKDTFDKKVVKDLADEIAVSDQTFAEEVIMASIVQREAGDPEQMSNVAGILWNRVRLGMALNADATLQYAKGYNKEEQSWWVPPLAADKELDSKYNTYKNVGLPPGPISNPGVAAMKAVLAPTPSNNLYYLHDKEGQIHYAETLQQHNQNVQKYLR